MPKKITEPKQPSGTIEVPVGYKIVTAKIPFVEKASRLETLIIRPIWMIPIGLVTILYALGFTIIVALYAIAAYILMIFNWLSSFFLGHRMQVSFNWSAKFISANFRYMTRLANYSTRRMPYFMMMTDQRPSLNMEPDVNKEAGGSLA